MKLSHLSAFAVAAVIGLSASAPAAHAGVLGGLADAMHNVGSRVQNAQGGNQRVASNSTSGAFGYLVPLRQCADRAYAYMGVTSPTADQQTYINARCYADVYGKH